MRPLGSLEDGTPYYAPLGQLPHDPQEDRVQCHLCGEWYRLVGGTHLAVNADNTYGGESGWSGSGGCSSSTGR